MSKIIKIGLPLTVILFSAAMALSSCSDTARTPEGVQAPRPVLVVDAQSSQSGVSLTTSATVRARHRALLSFALPGRVAVRLVEVGQRVERGQLLARLEDTQFRHAKQGAQAASKEAVAQLDQLRRDLDRVRHLHKRQAASREELEKVSTAVLTLEARLGGAKVQVGEARRMLSDTRIVAPFAGVITYVGIEAGEYAQPGRGVIRLSGDQELEVEIELPESALSGVTQGSKVEVSLPILGVDGLKGHLRSISRGAEQGLLFSAIVALDAHEALLPGVTAQIRLHTDAVTGFSVPIAAILSPSGGDTYVYRVGKDSRVEKIPVVAIQLRSGAVRVEGALVHGDSIVVAGHANLSDGQEVDARELSSSPLHSELSR
ncbi:MAG: efflux RND transporter periplasmic adaptor subunit [Kofleriaceae bacterium]|nr:efflux RND transporter periplasmic adaptor subunit [Kofleriaceae bacterium]